MKIKTKVLLGSLALIIILLVLTSAGVNNIMILNDRMDEIHKERFVKMEQAYRVRGDINALATGISDIIMVPESLEDATPQLEQIAERASATFVQLQESVISVREQQLVNTIMQSGEAYMAYAARAYELVRQGNQEEAIALRINEGIEAQRALVQAADEMAQYYSLTVDRSFAEALGSNDNTLLFMSIATIIGLILGIGAMLWNIRTLSDGLGSLTVMIRGFADGTVDPSKRIDNIRSDEFGDVARIFNTLAENLEQKNVREQAYNARMKQEAWIQSNTAEIGSALQQTEDVAALARTFIRNITPLVGAAMGALYVREGHGEQPVLSMQAGYAYEREEQFQRQFTFGQGLVGECAQDGQPLTLEAVPPDYVKITSAIGQALPTHVQLVPVQFQNKVLAVVEIAALHPFTEGEQALLMKTTDTLGIVLNNLFARLKVEELLKESQVMGEELQAQSEELISQQEELRRSNEQLEEQTRQLKKSEELLQSQQEELEQTNDELMQKTHMLELQMKQTEQKNKQIERTKAALEKQTIQLALSSKYKSEFLTNMSHELRTPLNSLLILSQMLMDNKEGNLTEKQVEFASTIYSSGSDLLKLIDEILDLSKISAGKMDVVIEHVPLAELDLYFRRSFTPISLQKNVAFETRLADGVPAEMYTDSHRVKQIIKNLLSNAFKFTAKGKVELTIRKASPIELAQEQYQDQTMLAFEVKDTGIGIPKEKQQLIFEAFQQVDGTTSRIYGGTGLGLAISRELAGLLGGTLELESEEGVGSTFTLYLPEFHVAGDKPARELHEQVLEAPGDDAKRNLLAEGLRSAVAAATSIATSTATSVATGAGETAASRDTARRAMQSPIEDDTDFIEPGDKVVLIIEDDPHFAKVLLDMARARGFKCIVAMQGDKGLSYARTYHPDAILLDIQLPVIDGWTVLNQLKQHADTRHIPVHVISVVDDIQHGLSMGAIAYLKKPTDKSSLEQVFQQIETFMERDLKRLLVVEDDAAQRISIVELIGHDDILITAVASGREALEQLKSLHYDCMVLDLGLPDITGFELLDAIRSDERLHDLPVIIYTGRELDKKEELRLKKYVGTIIIKDVKSPERLLEETTLFLHRVEANLPEEKRSMLRKLHNMEHIFEGKHVLIVDDDIRNVFALSSVLEAYKMEISFAETGKEALEKLSQGAAVDLILMDMMMPEMDGYETMREIRSRPGFEKLPIIAVTAKAMKGDRDKCIEAGASDYIAKPVNNDQLLSLMRVWLYK